MSTIRFGSYATGKLVWSPQQPIQPVEIIKPKPPEPPVSKPARATITSFETPIRVGKPSRAVASVTQGKPDKFRWQWQSGGVWHTGAENPASDLDHSFNRPNGAWDNVFPAVAGKFPIRLQTLVNGAVVDQTGTLRIIEVQDSPVPPEPPTPQPTPGPAGAWRADGRIFRLVSTGEAVRYKGVTAFKLCRLHADGQDIGPFLSAYAGYNVLRVWDYVTWTLAANGMEGWDSCTPDQWRVFLKFVGLRGWMVECTLLTNDDPLRITPAKALVAALSQDPRPDNLMLEIGNEPETHKHISTASLRAVCDASGFLYASGNYEKAGDQQHPSSMAFGFRGVAHSDRDSEWPRRAHDLKEYFEGGGPHYPAEPKRPFPWVEDEPPKEQDVNPPPAPNTKADDWRAYFGTSAILGAGATFHSQTGKEGKLPTPSETVLLKAALEGLDAFPAMTPLGNYSRPSDHSLRTYVVGNAMVRIRPTTSTPPINGFMKVGASNILWRR